MAKQNRPKNKLKSDNVLENQKNMIDEDDFLFTPITDGLGFQSAPAHRVTSLPPKRPVVNNNLIENNSVKKIGMMPLASSSLSLGGGSSPLSPFISSSTSASTSTSSPSSLLSSSSSSTLISTSKLKLDVAASLESSEKVKVYEEDASVIEKAIAFVIDLAFLVSVFGLFLAAILFIGEMNLGQLMESISLVEMVLYLYVFFGIFYVFYFSLLEKTLQTTLGKSLLSLSVKTEKENPPIEIYFLKSLLTYVMLPLFGVPMLLRLDEVWLKIKVISHKS